MILRIINFFKNVSKLKITKKGIKINYLNIITTTIAFCTLLATFLVPEIRQALNLDKVESKEEKIVIAPDEKVSLKKETKSTSKNKTREIKSFELQGIYFRLNRLYFEEKYLVCSINLSEFKYHTNLKICANGSWKSELIDNLGAKHKASYIQILGEQSSLCLEKFIYETSSPFDVNIFFELRELEQISGAIKIKISTNLGDRYLYNVSIKE